jgi:hypothetical protein
VNIRLSSNEQIKFVTPAKAGVQGSAAQAAESWIPAFAGMTMEAV